MSPIKILTYRLNDWMEVNTGVKMIPNLYGYFQSNEN